MRDTTPGSNERLAGATSDADEPRYAISWREAAQGPSTPLQHLRQAARRCVLSLRAGIDRRDQPRFLRCLFCHYVFEDQRSRFDRVLSALQSRGRFVTTDRCMRHLSGESPIEDRLFHLSFDDGFRNMFTVAAPILRDHGIKAAFFVPTAIIGANRREADRYCRRIQYPATIELMSWDDVGRLRDEGHDIGSHTRTHARFSDVSGDPARIEDEIAGSKAELERRLGAECDYISWPYGRLSDADRTSLDAARRAGYQACFGAFRGSIQPGRTDPHCIPRHHFEVEWPLAHIEYFARGNMEAPDEGALAR